MKKIIGILLALLFIVPMVSGLEVDREAKESNLEINITALNGIMRVREYGSTLIPKSSVHIYSVVTIDGTGGILNVLGIIYIRLTGGSVTNFNMLTGRISNYYATEDNMIDINMIGFIIIM